MLKHTGRKAGRCAVSLLHEGAGRKRTPVMVQRAALRPYLHGLEQALVNAFPRRYKIAVVRYADDVRRRQAAREEAL